jgi:surfeit locus 1 family protein
MRIPLLPTLLVGLAVAAMVGLGIWQIQRSAEKKELVARYEAAARLPPLAWPVMRGGEQDLLYRRATGFCTSVEEWNATAGRSADGQSGWMLTASCRTGAEGPGMQLSAGWSADAATRPAWDGGPVAGTIVSDREHGIRLVADPPVPGLAPLARPDPGLLPDNHLFYAVQWFLFALAAAVIYVLALQRRAREAA